MIPSRTGIPSRAALRRRAIWPALRGLASRARRAAVLLAVLATLGTTVAPAPAAGHGLLAASDPAAGANLPGNPASIRLAFTERPDPSLSSVRVLDAAGRDLAAGAPRPDPDDPDGLVIDLAATSDSGVFTVAWRIVSSVDGHATAGSFAFGVGVTPAPVVDGQGSEDAAAPPTPLAVLGRLALYVGLVGLVGVGFVVLVVIGPRRGGEAMGRLARLAALEAGLVGLGTLGVIGAQVETAGASLEAILGSSLGLSVALRALLAGLVVAVAAVALGGRRAGGALMVAGLVAVAGIALDAASGHAAAGSMPAGPVAIQAVHGVAVGTWLGGLAALLVATRGAASEASGRWVRRYSAAAAVGIAFVALTGAIRAVAEVGSIEGLTGTDFGAVVAVKIGLLVGLAGLGAINRFRMVPRAAAALGGLRRVGAGELALGLIAIGATGLLVNLVPPASRTPATAPPPSTAVVVHGADFGTTVRLDLEVSPGSVGFNEFRVGIADFDTGQPIAADGLELRFAAAGRPEAGTSVLALDAAPEPGEFAATGANLSLPGTWRLVATIAGPAGSVEVPLQVSVLAEPRRIDVSESPGLPTIYTIDLGPAGAVQAYADPGLPGPNDLHATFFTPEGTGLPATSATLSAIPPTGGSVELTPRELEPGHFVATIEAGRGTWSLSIRAVAPDGRPLETVIDLPIQ